MIKIIIITRHRINIDFIKHINLNKYIYIFDVQAKMFYDVITYILMQRNIYGAIVIIILYYKR